MKRSVGPMVRQGGCWAMMVPLVIGPVYGQVNHGAAVLMPSHVLRSVALERHGESVGRTSAVSWSHRGPQLLLLHEVLPSEQSASLAANSLTEWDVSRDRRIKEHAVPNGRALSLQWTTQGVLTVLDRDEGHSLVWDATAMRQLSILDGNPDAVRWEWSRDGRHLASLGSKIQLWSVADGKLMWSLSAPRDGCRAFVPSAAFSPKGAYLAVSSSKAGLTILDAIVGKPWSGPRLRLAQGTVPRGGPIAWSPDGKYLAAVCSGTLRRERQVLVWNVRTGRLQRALPHTGHSISALAWSPDSNRLACSLRDRANVYVWHLADSRRQTLATDTLPTSLVWSPDGRRLAVLCAEGSLLVWDM